VKAAFERAIAAAPAAPGPRVALVTHYRRIGDEKGAVEAARAASAALPTDPQITDLYGSLLLATGDHGGARDAFTRLTQQLPQSPTPWLRLADANLSARDFTAALEAQRKALQLQPDHGPALVGLAKTYMMSGKPQEAIAEAKKLQREKPKQALGYVLEAELLAAQKKFAEAVVPMREGLARQPGPALAARQLALLQAANRTSEANAFADKWVKEHPKDVAFLVIVGQQRQQRGDVAGAMSAYRAALEIDDDNVVVLNNLAWMLNEQGKPEARDYAERAYQLAPLQPSIVDTYGTVLVKQGDTGRGLALLRMATNLQPGDPRLRMNLARSLARTGDKAGARRELEHIVKNNPRSSLKGEAEKMLQEL
jgi:putative PEP-CTERM system TPR-repeat lipoprotein